jgi:cellulose synthase/poly-beta-1,6-N-acetylglucosamine synthase-like glycosyltransferase
MRVGVDGKQFVNDGARFRFRGVTYGTFATREDGEPYPSRSQVKKDFEAIREAGFTVVRTYTDPPDDVLDLAADSGLWLLSDVFYPDWRYMVGLSRRALRRVTREAETRVRRAVRRFSGDEHVLGVSLANEIPADVIRWVGSDVVARTLEGLVEVVREEDPEVLTTYGNFPTSEYLSVEAVDFVMFNVFLEDRNDFRKYLSRLHTIAGERPLVLGEIGLHSGNTPEGEQAQASALDWQIETAIERGVAGVCVFSWTDEWTVAGQPVDGWHFGLTRADRTERPALNVVKDWNLRDVTNLGVDWPSLSIVICAYNAAATLDECLTASCALDYPELEILVVDDGSTDETPDIVRRHPRVRLLSIPHGGLAVARNTGFRAASGELIAYLDSDAYPSAEWPYYLVLGLDGRMVAGVGGPNVSPPADPPIAQVVARAPGGPIHVLLSDDRAEHLPGCNFAFWKKALVDVGGFDSTFTVAGDDVDVCWRLIDRGWELAYHPGALVWHHRRSRFRDYLGQQRSYGRSEALVQVRHPTRFTLVGTARWLGRMYNSLFTRVTRQRIYRGSYGAAAFQSIYRFGGHALDLAHQVGVPTAFLLLFTAPLSLLWPPALFVALAAVGALLGLGVIDFAQAVPPRRWPRSKLWFRTAVAALHLLQPLVRTEARFRHLPIARRGFPPDPFLSRLPTTLEGGILLLEHSEPRAKLADALVAAFQRSGLRTVPASAWEDYDALIVGSTLIKGELITTSYPKGFVQLRVRRRMRWLAAVPFALAIAVGFADSLPLGVAAATVTAVELGRGLWRTRRSVRTVLRKAAG